MISKISDEHVRTTINELEAKYDPVSLKYHVEYQMLKFVQNNPDDWYVPFEDPIIKKESVTAMARIVCERLLLHIESQIESEKAAMGLLD